MNDQELRALVRDAIARHAGGSAGSRAAEHVDAGAAASRHHPSHGLLRVLAGVDADGPCIIEPAVPCNSCGYCKSYGH